MTINNDEAHRSAAWWCCVIEPEDPLCRTIRRELGEEEARQWACAPKPLALSPKTGVPSQSWEAAWKRWHARAREAHVDKQWEIAEKIGAHFLIDSDPSWPQAFDVLGEQAPIGLWVKGTLSSQRAVSIVGARTCTPQGVRQAHEISGFLSERGWTIVSGGAFGIDIAAHRGALAAQGHTVAVMAGGVDHRYPLAHAADFHDIVEHSGALVSEVALTWRPAKWRFLGRNRLIAAWGSAVIVVEAGARSGAMATARRAMDIGRDIGAMPGSLTSATHIGCHELIRNGATLVRDGQDVREMLEPFTVVEQRTLFGSPVEKDAGVDGLEPRLKRVWEALPLRTRARLDRICRAAGMDEQSVLEALAELELRAMVESGPTGFKRKKLK